MKLITSLAVCDWTTPHPRALLGNIVFEKHRFICGPWARPPLLWLQFTVKVGEESAALCEVVQLFFFFLEREIVSPKLSVLNHLLLSPLKRRAHGAAFWTQIKRPAGYSNIFTIIYFNISSLRSICYPLKYWLKYCSRMEINTSVWGVM